MKKSKKNKSGETRTKMSKVGNFLGDLLNGDLLLRLKVDKILPYILVIFVMGISLIFIKLQIDKTLLKCERARTELENVRIEYAKKSCELISLEKLSTIESMLEKQGLEIGIPTKPADRIKE